MHAPFNDARRGTGVSGQRSTIVLGAAFVAALTVWPSAQPANGGFQIAAISARPDFVSGGDVLVRVSVPRTVPLDQARVILNGTDITSVFHQNQPGHWLTGLITGLTLGPNTLSVAASGRNGNGVARLTVVNHPIVGPVFAGPHEQPFICETGSFTLQSGEMLGKPLDANCSIKTRVDYYYRSTAAAI